MRTRHANEEDGELAGQDSFLDIVANIVGILILLVVVVGVRASQEIIKVDAEKQTATDPSQPIVTAEDVELAVRQAISTQQDAKGLIKRVVSVRRAAVFRDSERLGLNTLVAEVEAEIEQRRSELGIEQQRDFDLRRQLNEAKTSLEKLTRQQVALLSQAPETAELENLPTPLAKTVSGEEIHLRLAGGRVAFIPLDELIADLRMDAEKNLWQLQNRRTAVNTVGPLNGFRLRYRLAKKAYTARGPGGGTAQGEMIQLTRWELLPERERMGELVEEAIQPNSDLMHFLKGYRPESTTVTVWTYPGSFAEFRTLKESLFAAGFGTAGRPLPDGIRIGGSPSGSKSSAQ